jgi:hypothetical protein
LACISKRSLKIIEEGITLFDPVKKQELTRVKKPDDFFGQNEVVMIKKKLVQPELTLLTCDSDLAPG